jgi:hypothetical protein
MPTCIVNVLHLTQFCLGPGIKLTCIPQIVPLMTRRQALHPHIAGNQGFPHLAILTALRALRLWDCWEL